jgi:shikimate kinase
MSLLFLVGYAGSGKSSLGRRLAHRLGYAFVDTDKRVEESVGASIADIFYYEGEEYFRRAEREVLEALALEDASRGVVVATGGGMPTWQDNMVWMNNHGVTIYIKRPAEQIISRLTDYGREKRPMFRGKSDEELRAFMAQQMAEREPHYAKAQILVDCSSLGDDDFVEYVVTKIGNPANE